MNKQNPFHGVVVPLTTPFTLDGQIDEAAAERITDHIAEQGLGVFVLGTTGETASIQRTERHKLVEAAMRASAGRIPVYAGIGDNCLANSVIAAETYLKLGVTAVVAHLPSYYPLTDEEMKTYFEMLHARVNGPLVLYNIPATTRMSVPVSILESLADLPNCVGFKDSENVPGRMEEVYETLKGREDFSLFMGTGALSVASLKLGYDGIVPSGGNLVPQLWGDLYKASLAGDWDQAEALQRQVDEIATIFQNGRTLGQSLAALKVALEMIDLCGPTVLPPLRALEASDCESVRKQLLQLCPFLNEANTTAHRPG